MGIATSPQGFEEFEATSAPLLRPPRVSAYGRLSWRELEKPGAELEYLIDDWLSVGGRSFIAGPSGSGKSFLAIDTALSISTGKPWFGNEVMQPGLTIYQAGEGGLGIKKRLRAYKKHFGIADDADVPFELLPRKVDIFAADGEAGGDTAKLIEAILGIAAEYGPSVPLRAVFIDTLATAQGGADEISGKDMGVVLNNIDRINKATGAHVCLVHHMNSDGKKLRGHTSLKANVDEIILVSRNEQTGVRTTVLDKIKDGEDGKRFQFELMSIEVGIRSDGKRNTSCVCLPVGEKEAIRKEESLKGYRLTDQEILFMKALFEAERKHGSPVPADMDLPTGIRSIVPYDEVKRAYVSIMPNDATFSADVTDKEKADSEKRYREMLKKRLQRAREYLTSISVIGAGGEKMVWWTGKPLRAFPHTIPKPVQVHEQDQQIPLDDTDVGF